MILTSRHCISFSFFKNLFKELESVIEGKVEREEVAPYSALPKLTALTKFVLFSFPFHQ